MTTTPVDQSPAGDRWVTGSFLGLPCPADLESLLRGGPDYLTRAFRACEALGSDNAVREIVRAEEFDAGGTGKKALVTVTYETPDPALPEELFVKFSRNFDNELWDSARHLMLSEITFALLSRGPDFPVPVPKLMYGDVDPETSTGLIITECIPYGRGNFQPRYYKCADYNIDDPVSHYKAILRGLGALSGSHRAGKLPAEFEEQFPYDPAQASNKFGRAVTEETVLRRANRMFDFVEEFPQLFPDNIKGPQFRAQFLADIPDVLAASDKIAKILYGNPDFIAFAHWNANIDNCWFERQPDGSLRAGFLDWANTGQLSVAQSISGSISGAETWVWDNHLDELLAEFIESYAAHGGPRLDLDEVRLHMLLGNASGLPHSMGAPIAMAREVPDLASLTSDRDPRMADHENARIQLHMTTKLMSLWQTHRLGDLVRSL